MLDMRFIWFCRLVGIFAANQNNLVKYGELENKKPIFSVHVYQLYFFKFSHGELGTLRVYLD